MAQHKMKASLGGQGNAQFDPDCWLTSRDRTAMICGRDGDDGLVEVTLWDKRSGQFIVIYHDRYNGETVSAGNEYFTNAKASALGQLSRNAQAA